MAKYVFLYHGGKAPESEAEGAAVMQTWNQWFEGLGSAVVDMGQPTGPSATVASDGATSDGGGANPVNGYSIITADSLEAALVLAKTSPQLAAGGSIEVAETLEIM